MWVLAKALLAESEWLSSFWAKRGRLAEKLVLILYGAKDPTFGPDKLARWQHAFPRHRTLTYPEVGHFVAEELGSAALGPIADFLDKGHRRSRVELRQHARPLGVRPM
jgi:haloalkane dehalogenase